MKRKLAFTLLVGYLFFGIKISEAQTFDSLNSQFNDFESKYKSAKQFVTNVPKPNLLPVGFSTMNIVIRDSLRRIGPKSATFILFLNQQILKLPWTESYANEYEIRLFGGYVTENIFCLYKLNAYNSTPDEIYLISRDQLSPKLDIFLLPKQKSNKENFDYLNGVKILSDGSIICQLTTGEYDLDHIETMMFTFNPVTKEYKKTGKIWHENIVEYY